MIGPMFHSFGLMIYPFVLIVRQHNEVSPTDVSPNKKYRMFRPLDDASLTDVSGTLTALRYMS
jgi:hypothetical protein